VRRLLAAVCAALTIAALVTACGTSGSAVHGRVTAKDYEPARTTWITQPTTRRTCTTTTRRSGKKKKRTARSCRTVRTGRHRVTHHTPACWLLQLDTSVTVCATSTRWHHTHVGDQYRGSRP
jgi:hypothetical protein